jgi:hypothetical protein
MIISPNIAFIAWIPISLFCFRRYPVRPAILINFIAGWALLPSASYVPDNVVFPYWILGLSLPSGYFITKASILGFTGLLGVLLVDRKVFSRFRLGFWDFPMLFWGAVPLLSKIANPQSLTSGLRSSVYQLLAWGVPYLLGRLYFSDIQSLRVAAQAFVIAGLAYVPICLIEVVTGPQIYAAVYGYEPYRWVGAQRYLGFRPIGMLEDGNQLGMWMATSALIALGLWSFRFVDRILGIPIRIVVAILFGATLVCQSAGSVVLLLAFTPFIVLRRRSSPRFFALLLLLGISGLGALRLANVVSLHSLVAHNALADSAARLLRKANRGSFGWRLSQDERYVDAALQTPILGTGEWDWWKGTSSRPWGLWMLTFGMYGILGLLALESLLLIPVARAICFPRARPSPDDHSPHFIFAAAILMSTIDSFLNSAMILPILLAVGGLSTTAAVNAGVRSYRNRRPHALTVSDSFGG